MKRALPLILLLLITVFSSDAQRQVTRKNKYPSLLWEITGNGMKKPSYLIGTMHVSSKLAFNLPDSFYYALRQSDVVALETNPETWQEDMSKYDLDQAYGYNVGSDYQAPPDDYLTISTLKFYKYDGKIERSLYSNPSTINNLLYRTYGSESADFEEDTYLDMYIFQCGKKWGKKVAGVENYEESMKLMEEAYKDAARDKSRKVRSYDDMDENYSIEKLQEAYRKGDLDLLDSINRYNSFSQAFDEKFLFRRNEIQAGNIDSIMRSGSALFVGVGAAHLPGDRGVIEILRRKGYKLRPVKMGERAGRDKELVDKIRVPVQFHTTTAPDGLYKVDIPGKFYKFGEDGALDQHQYADMANGSYYMVTRIMTNAWMWSHTVDDVYRSVDSLLYENVPGKILTKTAITKNGYKGFDITNRTRRGDLQRYNIFITPFEVLFFKMSGNGDYVANGEEARKFFGSIQLKEYQAGPTSASAWVKYSPPYGGFSVDMPHEPYVGNDGSWIYDAEDKVTRTHYRVIRTDIHNYNFVEEDSFDLALMEESFMASAFIEGQLSRKHGQFSGYPVLDGQYRDKKGSVYMVRFLIQGPHYYTLVAHGKQVTPAMQGFIESFRITPHVYPKAREEKDTLLYFTAQSHLPQQEKKIRLDIPDYYGSNDEEEESEDDQLEIGTFRSRIIESDSTGEKIYVSFFKAGRYDYSKDSSAFDNIHQATYGSDTTRITRSKKNYILPNGVRIWETVSTDTGSSRTLMSRVYYKNGVGFMLTTQSDTLSEPSVFVKNFFESFTPSDTLKGVNPFEKKSRVFFEDFMSSDTLTRKRAVRNIHAIALDSNDLAPLKTAIASMNWNEKKYLDTKSSLINKLAAMRSKDAAAYLKELYYALEDTIQLQYAVLESLLRHQTDDAFAIFRDIINNEAPVLDFTRSDYPDYSDVSDILSGSYSNGNFLDELSDSLQLTKKILPTLLPLLNLEDYKNPIMLLLGQMVDSNLVSQRDYEAYFQKFLIEARQELRKQSIAEKKKAIEKAEADKEENKMPDYSWLTDTEQDFGNEGLYLYAKLLLPYLEQNQQVQTLIGQMLRSNDKRLKYNTMLLMIRKNKSYPDTLLNYFASLDEYRYELFKDLEELKKSSLFPAKFNNHLDLGRSSLLDKKSYGKPDSIVYLDRLPAEYRSRKGFVYFYKVKTKKDDLTWKIAMVGLVPEDPKQFEFPDDSPAKSLYAVYLPDYARNTYSLTEFTDTRLRETEELMPQLRKQLKKALYSRRKSAREFYDDEDTQEPGVHVD